MIGNRGFTLIEVLVAISLASGVALMAHRMFSGIIDASGRVSETRAEFELETNGWRRLTALVGSIEVGPIEADPFLGEPNGMSFTAWDRDANGWNVRRRLALRLVESRLLLFGLDANALCLTDSVRAVGLDYLLEPGASATWVKRWSSTASAPLAVRLRVSHASGADTVLLVIGPRG